MTTPYTVTTPEYVAWAKRGEEVGLSKEQLLKIVNDICEIVNTSEVDATTYNKAREQLRVAFDFDHCECD